MIRRERDVTIAIVSWLVGVVLIGGCSLGSDAQDRGRDLSIAADFEITEHGRLVLDESALPTDRRVVLRLRMDDVARGSSDLPVRIVSLDGRTLDTTATSMPAEGTGIHLEIDRDFLAVGDYLIQVNTAEKHSLSFRRYVLIIH